MSNISSDPILTTLDPEFHVYHPQDDDALTISEEFSDFGFEESDNDNSNLQHNNKQKICDNFENFNNFSEGNSNSSNFTFNDDLLETAIDMKNMSSNYEYTSTNRGINTYGEHFNPNFANISQDEFNFSKNNASKNNALKNNASKNHFSKNYSKNTNNISLHEPRFASPRYNTSTRLPPRHSTTDLTFINDDSHNFDNFDISFKKNQENKTRKFLLIFLLFSFVTIFVIIFYKLKLSKLGTKNYSFSQSQVQKMYDEDGAVNIVNQEDDYGTYVNYYNDDDGQNENLEKSAEQNDVNPSPNKGVMDILPQPEDVEGISDEYRKQVLEEIKRGKEKNEKKDEKKKENEHLELTTIIDSDKTIIDKINHELTSTTVHTPEELKPEHLNAQDVKKREKKLKKIEEKKKDNDKNGEKKMLEKLEIVNNQIIPEKDQNDNNSSETIVIHGAVDDLTEGGVMRNLAKK
jgi:hypothetical protein